MRVVPARRLATEPAPDQMHPPCYPPPPPPLGAPPSAVQEAPSRAACFGAQPPGDKTPPGRRAHRSPAETAVNACVQEAQNGRCDIQDGGACCSPEAPRLL